jgi:thioredoxin reductase (NADPH)
MDKPFDVIIIGAGAAGLTAGIYAARANMKTVLLEKFVPGGQTALTAYVENYPGFPEGISGFELMDNMRKQALKFGLTITTTEVQFINPHDDLFCIGTTSCKFQTRTIIVCTGVRPRKLNVPGEKEFFGKGVSTCAICDGTFYRDREVVVIGGGDSALEEGMYLTRFASKVHIIHRRDRFRALPTFVDKARNEPKIVFHTDSTVTAINGDRMVEGVTLKNIKTGEESNLPVAGVFLYIGLLPNTEMFRGLLDMDQGGFIKVDTNLKTSVPGIFAAGDVRVTPLRQIISAASDGAIATYSAGKYIEHIE